MIPTLYLRLAACAAILALLLAFEWWVYCQGQHSVLVLWKAEKAELQAQHYAEVERLRAVNRQVEVRYMDRVRTVQGKTQVITKEVPKYVTAVDNSRCTIPDGFISLLNAAAQGRMLPTGGTDSADGAGALAGAIPGTLHAE